MPDEKQNQDPGQQSEPPLYASPKSNGSGHQLVGILPILSSPWPPSPTIWPPRGYSPASVLFLFCPALAGAADPPPYCAIAPAKGRADRRVACLTALCAVLLLPQPGDSTLPALLRILEAEP